MKVKGKIPITALSPAAAVLTARSARDRTSTYAVRVTDSLLVGVTDSKVKWAMAHGRQGNELLLLSIQYYYYLLVTTFFSPYYQYYNYDYHLRIY